MHFNQLTLSKSLSGTITAGTVFFQLFFCACQQPSGNQATEKNTNTHDTLPAESFHRVEQAVIDSLNRKINSTRINDVQEIPGLYRPKQTETEGNYQYLLSNQLLNDSTTEVTLTETGLADDAVKGIKTVFVIRTKGKNQYTILEMKENYQCYRGHSNWSAEICP